MTEQAQKAKRVAFSASLPPLKRNKPEDPRKIKMGKANPLRDLLVFLGVMGGLVAYFWSDETVIKDQQERETARLEARAAEESRRMANIERIREMQASKEREVYEKMDGKRRRAPCDIFVGPSSVPGAGLGLFAGRDFAQGDMVVEDPVGMLPLLIDELHATHPMTLLLQHHPTLANARPQTLNNVGKDASKQFLTLQATSAISTGQELFLTFDDHPHSHRAHHSLFRDMIPPNDFRTADHILSDMLKTVRSMEVGKRKNACKMDASSTYRLMHDTVARLHPRIGRLFPTTRSEYMLRPDTSSAVSTLRNQTLQSLQLKATCLSDLVGGDDGLVAARDLRPGDVIAQIPMVAVIPSRANLECFTEQDLDISLCPLWVAPAVSREGNAAYEWTDAVGKALSKEAALLSTRGSISWNLITTQNITTGQVIRATEAAAFPSQWRRHS